jgi:hypothetical protein
VFESAAHAGAKSHRSLCAIATLIAKRLQIEVRRNAHHRAALCLVTEEDVAIVAAFGADAWVELQVAEANATAFCPIAIGKPALSLRRCRPERRDWKRKDKQGQMSAHRPGISPRGPGTSPPYAKQKVIRRPL